MSLNLQWGILELLTVMSVAAWGFTCIVQVERGVPTFSQGRYMFCMYMYMNVLLAILAATNKSRARRVQELKKNHENSEAELEKDIETYDEFLFSRRHDFASLNPAVRVTQYEGINTQLCTCMLIWNCPPQRKPSLS